MADITYIPIRQLYPHPDNPRKELGDLSELAASIKENGVYQNLTVIPGHYLNSREYIRKCVDGGGDAAAAATAWTPKAVWSSEDYTIIIGHRRAAAAQQAGLYELPCAIVEMDEREQMQTMMIENTRPPSRIWLWNWSKRPSCPSWAAVRVPKRRSRCSLLSAPSARRLSAGPSPTRCWILSSNTPLML